MPPPLSLRVSVGQGIALGGSMDWNSASTELRLSYEQTEEGTVKLLSESHGEYNINSQGLLKTPSGGLPTSSSDNYRIAGRDVGVYRTVGSGASAVVHQAIHVATGNVLAVKNINVLDKDKRAQMLQELRTLCDITAKAVPGLVSFYGAFFNPNTSVISVALEYMDAGSLADVLKRVAAPLPEAVTACLCHDVLVGLAYLHTQRKALHRDLKPGNILLGLDGTAKLSDFGISQLLDSTVAECASFVGTVTYMSPERVNNQPYSFAADVWSLGLTALECVIGRYPYNASGGPFQLMLQVVEDAPPSPPPGSSGALVDFLGACLHKEPSQRSNASSLLAHPFVAAAAADSVPGGHPVLRDYLAGAFPVEERVMEMARAFAARYYLLLGRGDEGIAQLANLYGDTSCLVHMSERFVGREGIARKLEDVSRMHATFGHVKHEVAKVDAQPLVFDPQAAPGAPVDARGCILVSVTGAMSLTSPVGGSRKNDAFVETFVLQVLNPDGTPGEVHTLSPGRSQSVVVHLQTFVLFT
ncbi:mitogen-activated protein kinase kinase [Pycnococcus provasolii]